MKNELNEKKYIIKKIKQRTNEYLNQMMNTMCSDNYIIPC